MKKLKSFASFITIVSTLLLPLAPVLALGEVDLGTTGSAPTVTTETAPPAPPAAPTVSETTSTTSNTSTTSTSTVPNTTSNTTTPPNVPATTITPTTTNTTTTVGDTTVSTNTSTNTSTTDLTNTTSNVSVTVSDTRPPVISDIVSASVLPTEATVAWVTDELAVAHFRYGTTTNYGSTVTLGTSGALIHAATMLNLTAGTTYYYCIDATDLANNIIESCGHQFTTAAQVLQADTNPPTISSVVVAPITTASATVSWSTNELANGQVEYGTTQNYGSTTVMNTDYTLIDSANLSNLLPNTEYHYHITSRDEIGNTASTPDETFMTQMLAGTVQTNSNTGLSFAITAPETSGISEIGATISWLTTLPATAHIEYGINGSLDQRAASTALGTNHSASLSNLSPSTTYDYCIVATDAANLTIRSCGHTFATFASQTPVQTAPEVSSLTIAPIAETSATITWTTDKLSTAQIHYGTTSSYGSSISNTNLSLTHSTTLPNLSPNTTYHFNILSDDGSGHQSSTTDETFTTSTVAVTVNVQTVNISDVGADTVGETSATINWMTNVPSDSQVEYGNSINLGSITSINSALTANHSVTISNLIPDTNYIFKVKSKPLDANIATVSNLHEFSTLITPIFVTTPANITSVASSGMTTTGANIAWTTDIATTGHVEYGITTEYGQVISSPTNQSLHTMSLSDLAPDTTYHFRVKAMNTAGDITYSEDQTFTTPVSINIVNVLINPTQPVSAPSAIVNLSVAGHDETSALLSWNAATTDSDAAMFTEVHYSTNPITESNWNLATSAQVTPIAYPDLSPNGTSRTYFVAGLAQNTTYYFALKLKYEASSWSGISNFVSVTTLATLPVDTSGNTSDNEVQNTNAGNGELVSTPSISNTATLNSSNTGASASILETTTSLPIARPTFINATGRDDQIVFTWDNPNEADFVRTVIVRKAGSYPTSPIDGTTVYESDGKTFTDTNVTNGTTYYYAFYSYDHAKHYSEPVQVSLAPVAQHFVSQGGFGGGSGGLPMQAGGTISPGQFVLHETPVIVPAQATEHFTTVWKKGDQDIEVEHIQHVLRIDGDFYPGEKIDGQFGSITEKGLKQFQAKYNLPQSGITDQPTQKQLNISSQSLVSLDAPQNAAVLETDLKPGSKNDTVKGLQQLLADEGNYTGPVDGQFGQQTKSAVRAFQVKYFVKPPDGVVGPKTRHMLKILTGM